MSVAKKLSQAVVMGAAVGAVAGGGGGWPRVGWWVQAHPRLPPPAPALAPSPAPSLASAAISQVASLMTFLPASLPIFLELGSVFLKLFLGRCGSMSPWTTLHTKKVIFQ